MTWGPHAAALEDMPDDLGEVPPAPELSEFEEPYWFAFGRLNRLRGAGFMGEPMPISEEAMLRHAELFGPDDPDDLLDFQAVILALDEEWRRRAAEIRARKG
jgi:hypothetical protein